MSGPIAIAALLSAPDDPSCPVQSDSLGRWSVCVVRSARKTRRIRRQGRRRFDRRGGKDASLSGREHEGSGAGFRLQVSDFSETARYVSKVETKRPAFAYPIDRSHGERSRSESGDDGATALQSGQPSGIRFQWNSQFGSSIREITQLRIIPACLKGTMPVRPSAGAARAGSPRKYR
jgi:hypothetical protein